MAAGEVVKSDKENTLPTGGEGRKSNNTKGKASAKKTPQPPKIVKTPDVTPPPDDASIAGGEEDSGSPGNSIASSSKALRPVNNVASSMLSIKSGSSKTSGSENTGSKLFRPEIEVVFQEALNKEHECPVCAQYLRYPVQFDECGHRCCSACLSELIRVAPRCPIDNTKINRDKVYVDKTLQKEIDDLGVKCSYHENACPWEGRLKELFPHLEKCEHAPVQCTNHCGAEFEKRFLKQHLEEDCPKRGIRCQHCEEDITQEEEADHLEECPKVVVQCPNGCKKGGQILRENLENHLENDCPKQGVSCPFAEAGCDFKGERKDIRKHVKEQAENHLNFVNEALGTYRKTMELQRTTLDAQTSKLTALESSVEGLEKLYGSQIVWKVDNYSELREQARSGAKPFITSRYFLTNRHGYKLLLRLYLNGDGKAKGKFLSLFIVLCRGEYDPLLKWPFNHRVTLTLIDQSLNPGARRNISHSLKPNIVKENMAFLGRPMKEENAPFGTIRFCELDVLNTLDYTKGDCLFIKVDIDSDLMYMV